MTGIADVAREVNMSTATVSRALRGLPGVTRETRALVQDAAQRLGYAPSPSAARLASGRTRSIAVVVPNMAQWYFSTVTQGVERVLRRHDYDLLLYNLAGAPTARQEVFESNLLTKRVDAVIVIGLRPNDDELAQLDRLDRARAFVGVRATGCDNVCIDDELAARKATQHLIDLGHRRLAHVTGVGGRALLDHTTPAARRRGFRAVLAEAGLAENPDWLPDGLFTVQGGIAAGHLLLSSTPRPTGIVASSDEMALGVLRAAHELGLRVPEDVSVVGIDDHELAASFGLTTVAQPTVEQGELAAEMLVSSLETRLRGDVATPRQQVVETHLIVRSSTAGPPDDEGASPDH